MFKRKGDMVKGNVRPPSGDLIKLLSIERSLMSHKALDKLQGNDFGTLNPQSNLVHPLQKNHAGIKAETIL